MGQSDDALQQYREALRLAPRNAAAHNNLGLILLQRGELDEAMLRFEDALRLDRLRRMRATTLTSCSSGVGEWRRSGQS